MTTPARTTCAATAPARIRTIALTLALTVAALAITATPARADITAFLGFSPTPENHLAKGFAVGVSIADVIHAIALDQRRILPVSSLQSGAFGIHDVCLSVPTVVGRGGARSHIEVELWPKELAALQRSAQVLRETIDKVLNS